MRIYCVDGKECQLTGCTHQSRMCERNLALIAARPVLDIFHDAERKNAEIADLRAKLAEAQRSLVPVAWSPVSKTGLLRGIRYGTPSLDDLQIAEADGDTIKYFCEMPVVTQSKLEG